MEFESNYLTEDHEPIIDRDTWIWAQGLMRTRREELDSGSLKYHGGRTHFLYGKVFCASCGSPMTRRTLRCSSKSKEHYKAWECKECSFIRNRSKQRYRKENSTNFNNAIQRFFPIVRKRPNDGSGAQKTTMLVGCRFLEVENGEPEEEAAVFS